MILVLSLFPGGEPACDLIPEFCRWKLSGARRDIREALRLQGLDLDEEFFDRIERELRVRPYTVAGKHALAGATGSPSRWEGRSPGRSGSSSPVIHHYHRTSCPEGATSHEQLSA